MMHGLWIVPTPIGNLDDITLRAIDTLKEVSLILAEDTRHTSKLLRHYQVNTMLSGYHQHNEHRLTEKIVQRLLAGESMALVSDAGTPGISDAGFMLVRECVRYNVPVHALPGPTAFIPALLNSGLPMDRFVFEGFLPHKKGRQKRMGELAGEQRTIILYESPHRLLKTLDQLADVFGADRPASVSRELTKLHEENVRGSLSELLTHFDKAAVKGEFVIVVKGAS